MPSDDGADGALNELITSATKHSLLDDYSFEDGSIRLAVGTFEVNLDHGSAIDFLRSLLRAYQKAKSLGDE